jgi:hypothetical protein
MHKYKRGAARRSRHRSTSVKAVVLCHPQRPGRSSVVPVAPPHHARRGAGGGHPQGCARHGGAAQDGHTASLDVCNLRVPGRCGAQGAAHHTPAKPTGSRGAHGGQGAGARDTTTARQVHRGAVGGVGGERLCRVGATGSAGGAPEQDVCEH